MGAFIVKAVQHREYKCCPCWSKRKDLSKMVFNLCSSYSQPFSGKIFFLKACSFRYKHLFALLNISLIGRNVSKTHLKAPIRLSLLMALIFEFWSPLNSTRNGFRINSEDLAFAMKLDFASRRGILFGPTADTHAANGPT